VYKLFSDTQLAHLQHPQTAVTFSKAQWKKEIHSAVVNLDRRCWFDDLAHTDSGGHYKLIKVRYGQEPYIFHHDSWSTVLKFYLRSGSFGLRSRIFHGDDAAADKVCTLCPSGAQEDEIHFLLNCKAFSQARQNFAVTLQDKMRTDFHIELSNITLATPQFQMAYLLGRTEPHWHKSAEELKDNIVRPFLVQIAAERLTLT
jgi:hypothetical protein